MRLIKTKGKSSKLNTVIESISELEQYFIFAYLFSMLGIFPLYYKEQYYKIGDAKFTFFWKVSLLFVGVSFAFIIMRKLLEVISDRKNKWKSKSLNKSAATEKNGSKKSKRAVAERFLESMSSLDYAVFVYGICVLLSYAFSEHKDYAFKGATGWEMGLCSQLIFVGVYFLLSRSKGTFTIIHKSKERVNFGLCAKAILGIHMSASALVFLFGILHRFDIDPMGMYEGLNLNQKIEFLSTMGQATWFSSYVCTTFALGMVLFYISEKKWVRIISGIYTVVSFGILVTQNSDSAFIAIAGILLLLGYFSLSDMKNWICFLQIVSLMWGSFAGIGLLQKVFADWAIPLDSLSTFFSQSIFTWIMLILNIMLLIYYVKADKVNRNNKITGAVKTSKTKTLNKDYKRENRPVNIEDKKAENVRIMIITKKIYQAILFLLMAAVLLTILFIYLNTKGYLLTWFGYQSTHSYLLFDYHWGSNRGSTWMITWQAFLQMPFYQKLFGVGPDSLSEYLYSVPDISDLLRSLWGNVRLTNAHNEYLNSLMCYGIVGLVSWCGVLIGGITYFYKKAKENPFMIGFALCIIGYGCHNIFCYQQVCCTPFLFLVLGVGECLTKSENFNTIK